MFRKRARRLARREVLWALAALALIELALAASVDLFLDRVRDPEFAAKLDRLQALRAGAPDRPLVLVLGSSRTQLGLEAARLNGGRPLVFNFGLQGGGPMLERICLRRLRDAGVRPAILVVEIAPVMLAEGEDCPAEDRWLDGARLRLDEVWRTRNYYADRQRLWTHWLSGRALPSSRHQAELRDALGVDLGPSGRPLNDPLAGVDPYGWLPRPDETDPGRRAITFEKSMHMLRCDLASGRSAPGKIAALRDLLDDCRRAAIPTAALIMPESRPLRELYAEGFRREVDALVARLRDELGLRAVIDAREWVPDEQFWDAHHLASSGARTFTDRFAAEALPMLFERCVAAHD